MVNSSIFYKIFILVILFQNFKIGLSQEIEIHSAYIRNNKLIITLYNPSKQDKSIFLLNSSQSNKYVSIKDYSKSKDTIYLNLSDSISISFSHKTQYLLDGKPMFKEYKLKPKSKTRINISEVINDDFINIGYLIIAIPNNQFIKKRIVK
jgi:hypothetical protein